MHKLKSKSLILFILLLTSFFNSAVHSKDSANQKVYRVGVVPQFEARRLASIWYPILEHLGKQTGAKFELIGAPSISAFEKALLKGKYDIAYMNPYHLLLANEAQGYIPLVKDASKMLRGVLVVKKEGDINEIADLDGKVIAFPSPNALGASLQMRAELHDLFNIEFTPNYVKTHDSVYLNVLLGDADAGGGVGKTLKRQLPQYKAALKVLYKTRPVSPHPIAIHPRLPNPIKAKIKQSLLAMGKDKIGSSLLKKIPIKQVGETSLSDYLSLKKMNLERFYVKPK